MLRVFAFAFSVLLFFHELGEFIVKCDIDIRKDLHSNVVLSGGTKMLQALGAG